MSAGPYGLLLDAVRGVRWPAARRTGGATLGAHPSTLRGNSTEFSEFRPYRQGDDPRRLDWRLLARSDRAWVRLTTDRATLRTAVIVDASASMAFPVATMEKWVRGREVAIALAAIAHAEGDPVGLEVASATPVSLVPRARRSALAEMIRALDATTPAGSAPLAPVVTAVRATRLAIVTDLLGDAEDMLAAARLRIAGGAEAIVIHLVSPDELDPPAEIRLAVDPEDATLRRTLAADSRIAYRESFGRWLDEMSSSIRAAGMRYLRVETSEPAAHVVRRIAGSARAAVR